MADSASASYPSQLGSVRTSSRAAASAGTLGFRFPRGMDSDNAVISAFKDCPRLVTVALTGADPRMLELPVKQITCLRLSDNRGADYFGAYVDLISRCPLLEILHVYFPERARNPLPKSFTLPCLRGLTATSDPSLLDSLALPVWK
ncbi:hypothetical protein BDZ89DRAFT_1136037 [Hymenopellis radicata]|nr:hypothetical protein BDZ89DRAFT_1136037 [Hymenopellis radicata]